MSSSRGLTVSVATDDEIFAVCAARLRYASPLPAGVAVTMLRRRRPCMQLRESWIAWPTFYSPLAPRRALLMQGVRIGGGGG